MEIERFSREGNTLRFRGKIMGTMPITAVVTPDLVRQIIKSLGFSLLLFTLSMVFRKEPPRAAKGK